jgi:flagellar basal-body rod protein FlgB
MSQTVEILGKVMDAAMVRHEALANNLANVNTPNYIRKDIEFKDALISAIGDPEKLARVKPKLVEDFNTKANSSGNNVSMQQELSRMTQNSLLFDFAAEMAGRKLAGLRKAITGTK